MTTWMGEPGGRAMFRTVTAWDVEGVSDDVVDLDGGFHVIVLTFEGALQAIRFRHVMFHEDRPWAGAPLPPGAQARTPPAIAQSGWASTMTKSDYVAAVGRIRENIAAGTVYQVNACRMLSRDGRGADLDGLFADVLLHNPARHACRIDVAGHVDLVSASPELFLSLAEGVLSSAPIKGTAPTREEMLHKDATENIMITDLVRNDLQRVCEPGSVVVDGLLQEEAHPGLVHLVSTVRGRLSAGAGWADVLAATFPPGSVSGAPKSSALRIIDEIEPGPRGPYCGALGWIDATSGRAELAVGIRTFNRSVAQGDGAETSVASQRLTFGTGAGITWDSDPAGEWAETQLKAHRLVALAQRHLATE